MLVDQAGKWLRRKCAVVLTELATYGEEPDAIGWRGYHTTLVECKTSREDFRADAVKVFRREPERGIGNKRFFFSLPGVIPVEQLPENWGLLELTGSRIREVRASGVFTANRNHEVGLLLSTLRRIGHAAPNGVSIRCYTIQTQNRATLACQEL